MVNTLNTENPIGELFRKTGDPVNLISGSSLHPRRKSRHIIVGPVPVDGGASISVQLIVDTLMANVPATLQQAVELAAAGCDIMCAAVSGQNDADVLPEVCHESPIPVIANTHFQPKYVFQVIDASCTVVCVNPGNIRKFDGVDSDTCKTATDAGTLLRIGVNAGSLGKGLYIRYNGPTPEALVVFALKEAYMFEDAGFHGFKVSVKHHDVITMVEMYRLPTSKGDWSLHPDVIKAGLA